jgi:hypothetical protein
MIRQQKFYLSWARLLFVALLIVIGFIVLAALQGPATGQVFSNIVSELPVGYSGGAGGMLAGATPTAGAPGRGRVSAERLIIRNGSLNLIVTDPLTAQQAIKQMIDEMADEGAFIVSSNTRGSTTEGLPYISLSLRVPATHFDEVMDRLATLAVEVRDRNESAQDVTAEYVDLEARLEALEAARDRLRQIMDDAKTTEDLLQAEQQLTQREAEIESIKGQMQYFSQSAQLSSITVELAPSILSQPVDNRWRPAETVRQSFDVLLSSLRGFADFAIFFSIALLPWLLLAGAVILVVIRLRKRWRARQGQAQPETKSAQE